MTFLSAVTFCRRCLFLSAVTLFLFGDDFFVGGDFFVDGCRGSGLAFFRFVVGGHVAEDRDLSYISDFFFFAAVVRDFDEEVTLN
jgi:hypothetical protein